MECGGFALALEETEITYLRDRLYFSLLDYAMCLKIAFSFVRSKRCFVEILEKSIGWFAGGISKWQWPPPQWLTVRRKRVVYCVIPSLKNIITVTLQKRNISYRYCCVGGEKYEEFVLIYVTFKNIKNYFCPIWYCVLW